MLAEHDTSEFGIAVIDVFVVATTRHDKFGMPYLVRRQVDPSFIVVDTKVFVIAANTLSDKITSFVQDIEFDFNVQHDCSFAGCGPTGKRPRVQERIESPEATESFIEHCDVSRWIINIHSLHNGHLLRRCLPQDLVAPIPTMDPAKREEEHRKIASAYRPKQDKKREETAEKRAAKRPKKEAAGNNKVLGKRKADFDQDGG